MKWVLCVGRLPYLCINLSYLLFLELFAKSEGSLVEVVHRGLDGPSAGLHRPDEVLLGDAPCAEHVAVGEVLRGHVANGQLGKHHLGAARVDAGELLIQDVPFGINNLR